MEYLSHTITVGANQTYTLTDDVTWQPSGGVAFELGYGATLDLNGHSITGPGLSSSAIAVHSQDVSYVTVENGAISGFYEGIDIVDTAAQSVVGLPGTTNNHIEAMAISDCGFRGISIGGNYSIVDNSSVWSIGGYGSGTDRIFGVEIWGPNATVNDTHIFYVRGGSESAAVSFSGNVGFGSTVSDSTLDGSSAWGQSFGIWNSSPNHVTVTDSYVHDWDYGVASVGGATVSNSTFLNNWWDDSGIGSPTMASSTTSSPGETITVGSGGRGIGGAGSDVIIDQGGHDHLAGGVGANTFVFDDAISPANDSVILDFSAASGDTLAFDQSIFGAAHAADGAPAFQVGTYALGSGATFFENPYTYTLYYDPDGFGGQAPVEVAYVPDQVLTASDLGWWV